MFVYVIAYDESHAKIGVASDLRQRIDGLQTGCPFPLSVRFAIQVKDLKDAYRIEGAAHAALNGRRATGREWFSVPPEHAYEAIVSAAGHINYETVDCQNMTELERRYTLEENIAWYREMLSSYSDETIAKLAIFTGNEPDTDVLAIHFAKRLAGG